MSRLPSYAMPSSLAIAREIVDSSPVLGVFAACEWDELHDDGKLWISAIVAEVRRRFASTTPDPSAASNVRPAPFSLTPATVAGILRGTAGGFVPRIVAVPFERTKLVDQPRPSALPSADFKPDDLPAADEPVRVAPQQAAEPTPVETPCSTGVEETPRVPDAAAAQSDRLEMIRSAAASLTRKVEVAPAGRPSLGFKTERKKAALPPMPTEQRLRRLDGAIAFLKSNGIAVSVVDRQAPIRKYWLTGKGEQCLGDDVVTFAIERGFEPDGQAHAQG